MGHDTTARTGCRAGCHWPVVPNCTASLCRRRSSRQQSRQRNARRAHKTTAEPISSHCRQRRASPPPHCSVARFDHQADGPPPLHTDTTALCRLSHLVGLPRGTRSPRCPCWLFGRSLAPRPPDPLPDAPSPRRPPWAFFPTSLQQRTTRLSRGWRPALSAHGASPSSPPLQARCLKSALALA